MSDVEKALAKMIGDRKSKLSEEDRQQGSIQKLLNDLADPPKMMEDQKVNFNYHSHLLTVESKDYFKQSKKYYLSHETKKLLTYRFSSGKKLFFKLEFNFATKTIFKFDFLFFFFKKMPERKLEMKRSESAKEDLKTEVEAEAVASSKRDEGVSEAVWQELVQAQKREQAEQERIKWEQQEALRFETWSQLFKLQR